MRRCRLSLVIALTLGPATLGGIGAARAQVSPEVRSASVALFDEARRLMADGKFAEACPKLEESQRMDPGIGILFNLGDCYEHLGRTASAWISFRDVASIAGGS